MRGNVKPSDAEGSLRLWFTAKQEITKSQSARRRGSARKKTTTKKQQNPKSKDAVITTRSVKCVTHKDNESGVFILFSSRLHFILLSSGSDSFLNWGGWGGGASIYTAAVSLGLVFSCLIPLAVQLGAQFLKMGFLTGGWKEGRDCAELLTPQISTPRASRSAATFTPRLPCKKSGRLFQPHCKHWVEIILVLIWNKFFLLLLLLLFFPFTFLVLTLLV